MLDCAGADEGQRDGVCGRGGLLQSQQRHRERRQRGERSPQHQVHMLLIVCPTWIGEYIFLAYIFLLIRFIYNAQC